LFFFIILLVFVFILLKCILCNITALRQTCIGPHGAASLSRNSVCRFSC